MKELKKILFSIFCLFVFSFGVNAATCNDKDLNEWAENVYIAYEEDYGVGDGKGNIIREKEYSYLLFVYPYNKNIRVMARNNHTNKDIEIEYDDLYGTNVLGSYIHMNSKTYTFSFYGGKNSACPGVLLKSLEYTVPPYNIFSQREYCINNPSDDICKTYSNDMKDVTDKEFGRLVKNAEKQHELENMNFIQKVWYYIKKNWYFAVIPVVLVAAFYAIKIHLYKKKVDNE